MNFTLSIPKPLKEFISSLVSTTPLVVYLAAPVGALVAPSPSVISAGLLVVFKGSLYGNKREPSVASIGGSLPCEKTVVGKIAIHIKNNGFNVVVNKLEKQFIFLLF